MTHRNCSRRSIVQFLTQEPKMPNDKRNGIGNLGWTEKEKSQGAPTSGDAGAAGEAVPKAGYGGDDRAATEAAAAQVDEDLKGEADPEDRER
jgi:hypothetical protein